MPDHDRIAAQIRRGRELLAEAQKPEYDRPSFAQSKARIAHIVDLLEMTLLLDGYPICPGCGALMADPCDEDCQYAHD